MHWHPRRGFTLIELLVVIAIIAILAVVVVLTLNPAELLRQSRDANRVSDIATLTSALNLYSEDQAGTSKFNLGTTSNTNISIPDPLATSTNTCPSLGLSLFSTSTGQAWQCAASSTYRNIATGWLPVPLANLSGGSPISNLPIDPVNQTSSGLFYSYNTNGTQFVVTANLESAKYKTTYGNAPQTSYFPEVISGGNASISALYNPTGLIGYWPMNEGSGSSTIDQGGNGNVGTWNGTPSGTNSTYYTGGKVGSYAGDFNGTNDYVNVPDHPTNLPFSLCAWIDPQSSPSQMVPIGYMSTSSAVGWDGWYIIFYPANWQFGTADNNTFTESLGAVPVVHAWQFVCGIVASTTSKLIYVNGVAGTVDSSSNTPSQTNQIIGIGASVRFYIDNYFNGFIDDVRMYSRALSPAEIMALYTAEK
jgi:prepilin-type N-terminal cleavage/methylation domain-containing protein